MTFLQASACVFPKTSLASRAASPIYRLWLKKQTFLQTSLSSVALCVELLYFFAMIILYSLSTKRVVSFTNSGWLLNVLCHFTCMYTYDLCIQALLLLLGQSDRQIRNNEWMTHPVDWIGPIGVLVSTHGPYVWDRCSMSAWCSIWGQSMYLTYP